jgi:hypothetical protein
VNDIDFFLENKLATTERNEKAKMEKNIIDK